MKTRNDYEAMAAQLDRKLLLEPENLGGVPSGDDAAELGQPPMVEGSADQDTEQASEDDDGKRASQSALLVGFVQERAELFHDKNKDTFAQLEGVRETMRLNSTSFLNWLSAAFYKHSGKTPRTQAVRE